MATAIATCEQYHIFNEQLDCSNDKIHTRHVDLGTITEAIL